MLPGTVAAGAELAAISVNATKAAGAAIDEIKNGRIVASSY
jgi:hypothetical protein